ncbi:MAG: N-6 DNA methylase [Elusimicrobia bacterium]|nr:N-6 DNA methylase [Elusimicrobiota bacterium]
MGIKPLGKKTGVNYAYLSRIESGQVQPSEDVIRKLAKALGHDEAELMLLTDRVPPAWRPIIRRASREATLLMSDSIESYETGLATVEPLAPDTSESTEPDEAAVEDLARWARFALQSLEHECVSPAYRKTFAAWTAVVKGFVQPEEQQFRLHIVLNSLAFSLLWRMSKNNADILLAGLYPETWKPAANLVPTIDRPLLGTTNWHPAVFQRLYAILNSPENQRELGKVYTPSEIVSYILDQLGFSGETALSAKLLDPASGCGIFLLAAAERICQAAGSKPLARDRVLSDVAGLDNDLTAVCLAKMGLAALLSLRGHYLPKHADFKVFLADTLDYDRDRLPFATDNPEVMAIKRMHDAYASGFDFVVGNPPYGKMTSTDPRVGYFKDTVYGHANMYGMFLQFALEHLNEEGKLGFIVPKSFSSGLYFKRLREFMLNRVHLDQILTFESRTDVFHHSDVLQETVILLCSRDMAKRPVILKEVRDHHDLADDATAVRAKLEEVDFGQEFDHILCTSASRVALDILNKVRASSKPLEALGLRASTGKFVWNRFKHYLHDNPAGHRLPLYWMHNIKPFQFVPDASNGRKAAFVDLNDETRSWLNRPEELILNKRISAKEQKRRIEACYVPASWRSNTPGYFVENHLNFIFRRDRSCVYDMKALAALLNSKLLDFVFRLFNGNTQVSATELNILPLPAALPKKFVELAQSVIDAPEGKRDDLERELNQAVYALYGLDGRERTFVEGYFTGYGR